VVVVEPSINQRWTRSVIDAVKNEAYPGENIEAVIGTHTHFDHFGGIRELAQESGKVYIGQDGVAYTEEVLNNNSALLPDTLAANPTTISVEGVSGITTLDGGTIEIHLLDTSSLGINPHSEDMVGVYVPEYEAFIVADIFNSGGFVGIAQGFGANNFNAATSAVLSERANYLLDYIDEKNLTVSKVIAIHNGVGTLADLEILANL
jgi:glyoxylase-like metal-dependent hydrolase (beta-lactamase superfamily II)